MKAQFGNIICKKGISRATLFLAILLLLAPDALPAAAINGAKLNSGLKDNKKASFFILTDIHFNPFASPGLADSLITAPVSKWSAIFQQQKLAAPAYGSDTNYGLLLQCLAQMKKVNPHPDFIIIAGDFLGHQVLADLQKRAGTRPADATAFIAKSFQFLDQLLADYFPSTPVYPVLGNNDTPIADYQLSYNDGFLKTIAQTWLPLLKAPGKAASFNATFSAGGYYTTENPHNHNNKIILLNTAPLSASYQDDNQMEGKKELSWLRGELEKSKKRQQKVWLVYHIPPGIDPFKSSRRNICDDGPATYWQPDLGDEFISLIYQYRDVVKMQIAGHTHMDGFKVMVDGQQTPYNYIHLAPALSPIFGNNPAFQSVLYDPATAAMTDCTTWFMDVARQPADKAWAAEYSFGQAYNRNHIDAKILNETYHQIASDSIVSKRYIQYYNVSHPASPIDSKNFYAYWCGIGLLQKNGYVTCFCSAHAGTTQK